VSKEASGPQQFHPLIQFWLTNSFKIQKWNNMFEIFSLYKFRKSFVFLGPEMWVWGQHFQTSSEFEISHGYQYTKKEWE
jgi:hypothetical protein